ncbi:hypothetical protein [Streptomyces longwoodensis]|uniref:hypothetical protein n=1 Tax=Streptomyces longwoodensis TaxID=68231 RepID=UPI00324CDB12
MDERWAPHSPLSRGAAAALAHLEGTGQDLNHVEVDGRYLDYRKKDEAIECFIALSWRYWRSATRYLDDGQAWFEVLPAQHPLHALQITPGA